MHDIWNPWHGCVKCSEGCQHCHIHNLRGKLGMGSKCTPFSIRCARKTEYCFEVDSDKINTT